MPASSDAAPRDEVPRAAPPGNKLDDDGLPTVDPIYFEAELMVPAVSCPPTSGRGSGVVGYNVQVAVDTANHLIITHEVTNVVDNEVFVHVAGA
jgi:hypothetical protein